MTKLTVTNASINSTFIEAFTNSITITANNVTFGNIAITANSLTVGNSVVNCGSISVPRVTMLGSSFGGSTIPLGGIVDFQEFTAGAGTWFNPIANAVSNASLTGYEQVFIMMWGGGANSPSSTATFYSTTGGGGSCLIISLPLSSFTNTCALTVGASSTSAANGGNTTFTVNSTVTLAAYGGAAGNSTAVGAGAGVFGPPPSMTTPGGPLGNSTANGVSIFGGTGSGNNAFTIFGGTGGAGLTDMGEGNAYLLPGKSIFGGVGGDAQNRSTWAPLPVEFDGDYRSFSTFAGDIARGGNRGNNPGAGSGNQTSTLATGSGRIRVWVIGPGGTTAGAPTYTLTANTTTLSEGSSVLYTVSTTNVPNNTILYYTLNNSSSATSADFTTAVNGSVVINSGTGTFTLTANNDADSTESFQMDIRTGSSTGTIVASNGSVSLVPFTGGDITVVSTSAAQTDVGSSVSLTMPVGIQQDDLVIISHLADTTPIVPSGWTEITFTPASVAVFKAFYKFMGSTPDTSVTLQASGGATSIASVALALRNANTSPLDGTATSTAININDPAAITTSKANSYVIIVGLGYGGFGSITNASGYTQANTIGNGGEGLMVSYKKVLTPSTENPPTFTISSDDSSTVTFAIKNNVA